MQQYSNQYFKERKHKNAITNCLCIAIIVIIFLMSMDFKTRMYYLGIMAFCLTAILHYKDYNFHAIVIPTIFLSISLAFFSSGIGTDINSIIRIFIYPLCVLTGYNIIDAESKKSIEKRAIWVIIALAAGAYIHFILNFLINFNTNSTRNALDYWTQSKLSATGHSSLACMMIGVAITESLRKPNYSLSVHAFLPY